MDEYEEHEREISGYRLNIVAYKLGTRFICIISNLDPGATICRVSSWSREAALRKAVTEASSRLGQTVVLDPPIKEKAAKACLSRLEYSGDPAGAFTVSDFLALDAGQRVQYILSGMLLYFTADGSSIPPGEAMKELRQACAA